jgi:hypothetical protein
MGAVESASGGVRQETGTGRDGVGRCFGLGPLVPFGRWCARSINPDVHIRTNGLQFNSKDGFLYTSYQRMVV